MIFSSDKFVPQKINRGLVFQFSWAGAMDELVEKVIYTSAEFLSYILVCITLTLTLTHTHKKSASCTPGAGAGNRCNRCKMVKSSLSLDVTCWNLFSLSLPSFTHCIVGSHPLSHWAVCKSGIYIKCLWFCHFVFYNTRHLKLIEFCKLCHCDCEIHQCASISMMRLSENANF